MKYETKWRIDFYTYKPEKLTAVRVSNDYFFVKETETTVHKTGLFDSPSDAFIDAFRDVEASLKWAKKKERNLILAHERFMEESANLVS